MGYQVSVITRRLAALEHRKISVLCQPLHQEGSEWSLTGPALTFPPMNFPSLDLMELHFMNMKILGKVFIRIGTPTSLISAGMSLQFSPRQCHLLAGKNACRWTSSRCRCFDALSRLRKSARRMDSNENGGKENLEAIEFIKHMNSIIHIFILMPHLCRRIDLFLRSHASFRVHGLGFDLKWNMGWMNDTLRYFKEILFPQAPSAWFDLWLIYAFSERFILVLSHDEVVHGKAHLISKLPATTGKICQRPAFI